MRQRRQYNDQACHSNLVAFQRVSTIISLILRVLEGPTMETLGRLRVADLKGSTVPYRFGCVTNLTKDALRRRLLFGTNGA